MRFYLGLYNLSNQKKTGGINKKLREMGEEPVILDQGQTHVSKELIKSYLATKGYLNAEVEDTTLLFSNRKANVIYRVYPNTPYTIRSLKYSLEDTSIQRFIYNDSVDIGSNLKIWKKGLFDTDVLNKERANIEYYMRNNGFYRFSRDFISYDVDTSMNQVDLVMNISKETLKTPNGQIVSIPHNQYKINQVIIRTENSRLKKTNTLENFKRDTILKYGVKFIYHNNFWVRPNIIQQSNFILPGSLYRISDVEQTKSHLSSLNVFSIVNTNQFNELSKSDSAKFHYLDCTIRLTPSSIQSYDWGVVGTNSSGNFGGAVTFSYQHRSLFGNAENLNLKLRWALEALTQKSSSKLNRDLQYGAEITLNIPKFLIPFNSMSFKKKYNPKTYLTLAYNFQDRPDFTRTGMNTSFGYNWKGSVYKAHTITPLEINYVYINKSPQFDSVINKTYLENIYTSHLITATSYTYTYNNQDFKKRSDYRYFRGNFESAGNLLNLYSRAINAHKEPSGDYYKLFKLRYSQYIKGEADFHYFHVHNEYIGTAYRLFGGIGIPYGNANVLPFEKQFFSGGANSIRGWQVRSLGPGGYLDTISKYPNSTGDIKLEGNVEYRFKLFWVFEGALFADAGNIWLLPSNSSEKPTNAVFRFDQFYKQIALGSGLGLRLNFNYFLIRVDLGIKVRNPALDEGKRWIFNYNKVTHDDLALSFSIGYPF
jgi:outer membrane protein assembly factor BamA